MAGRPKIQIDYELVKKLASIQCTEKEIASVIGCTDRTMQNDPECMKAYYEGLDQGKMSLRRTQFKLAEKNAPMAIFLGKQYLGQRDVIEEKHEVNNGVIDELVGALNNAKRN